jgi:drug/metabolite transporter (DMT)-like permease
MRRLSLTWGFSMSDSTAPDPASPAQDPGLPAEPSTGSGNGADEGREHMDRRLKVISGAALAGVGILAAAWAAGFGFGSVDQPGPGFWPVLLGAVLCVSAIIFVMTNRDLKEMAFGSDLGLAALMLAAVVGYILLFEHVHFLVAAPLLLAGTQYLAGTRNLLAIILTSVLGTAGAWVLFFQILNVSLPL